MNSLLPLGEKGQEMRGLTRGSASKSNSANRLLLNDDATEPGVHLLATSAGGSIQFRDKDGLLIKLAP
ncbi:MAG: hypothetical protein ACKVOI_16615 [Dongiaceae bacterium]